MTLALLSSLTALGIREIINAFLMFYSFRDQLRYRLSHIIIFYIFLFLLECTFFIFLGRFGTVRELYILGLLHVIIPFYMVKLNVPKYLFISIFLTYVVVIYQNLALTTANYYTMGLAKETAQALYNSFLTIVTAYPFYSFLRRYHVVIDSHISTKLLLLADAISFSYLAALLSNTHFGLIFNLHHLCVRLLILTPGLIFMFLVLKLINQSAENVKLNENINTIQELHDAESHYYETVLDNEKETLRLQQQLHSDAEAMLKLLEAKEYNTLEQHFNKLLLNSERLRHVNLCGHRVLDSVVGYWQLRAWEKDIDFLADINIDTVKINDLDLALILGNILENAFTAAAAPALEFRQIQLKIRTKSSMLLISCSNTFNGEIKQKGDEYLSSKRNFSKPGTGLANIKLLAEKYNGYLIINPQGSTFSLKLALQNKEDR